MNLKTPTKMNFTGYMEVNWKNWKQRLSFCLLATDRTSKSDETKVAILLTLIGEDGLNVYNTLKETKIYEKDKLCFNKIGNKIIKLLLRKKIMSCMKDITQM